MPRLTGNLDAVDDLEEHPILVDVGDVNLFLDQEVLTFHGYGVLHVYPSKQPKNVLEMAETTYFVAYFVASLA